MQRNVQFWRIVQSDGAALTHRFPAADLVKALESAATLGLDRHRVCKNGMTVLAHASGLSPMPMLLLDKVRRENYPSIGDRSGQRQAMRLKAGEGLLEPTYFSFLPNNVIAVLVNGNGPHPQRLAEYIRTKFQTPIGIEPVLRRDLDVVLSGMRLTEVEVAVPAERLDRGLVGGDWVEALDGARQLSHDGMIRIGLTVGLRGDAQFKASFSDHLRSLVSQLRQAVGFNELTTARVAGQVNGHRQVIDLIHDRFVERVKVDADKLGDPDKSVEHAREVLAKVATGASDYLRDTLPEVTGQELSLGDFDEAVGDDDEQEQEQEQE